MQINPIAFIYNDYNEKFGIPRQSGIVENIISKIIFEKEYRDVNTLQGLEDFSYIWLIWGFSEASERKWTPTVRPPRLGGNERKGVFATRSPFRPNSLGISSLPIDRIEKNTNDGPVIYVKGADLMNGTPIYDIKPYIAADCHQEIHAGFTDEVPFKTLRVKFEDACKEKISAEDLAVLENVLSNDPRPRYHNDPQRVYGMSFGSNNIKFSVDGDVLLVHSIIPI